MRGRGNVAKRVLLQAAAFNLALILRSITKAGTPKGLADLKRKVVLALLRVLAALWALPAPIFGVYETFCDQIFPFRQGAAESAQIAAFRKIEVLTRAPRSLSENPARSRKQSERNRHIMFYAKRLPGLPS